ncbi:hypothetical protein LguiA_007792 [Lonicera macranthoides]
MDPRKSSGASECLEPIKPSDCNVIGSHKSPKSSFQCDFVPFSQSYSVLVLYLVFLM